MGLYREVLVFWCFTGVRCVEFCLLKHFQYSAFVAPYKAWTLQNTLTHIQTKLTYIHFTHMLTINSSRYLGTIQDNKRHQQKPTDIKQHQQTVQGTPKGCSRMCAGSCRHWMAFADVCWCPMVSGRLLVSCRSVWRYEEGFWKFLKGYLSAVYGCV